MPDPTLWKYKTAHGEEAVTDRWEDIPAAQRSHAQAFDAKPATLQPPAPLPLPALHFDPLSFGGGVLLGAALAMIFARQRRALVTVALVTVMMAVGMSVYLGFLRKQAGLSSEALTTPQAIIGEVHGAAGAMKDHYGDQQRALEQIEANGK